MTEALSLGQTSQQGSSQVAAFGPSALLTGNEADEITPAIADLARGLQNDALKIYQYVFNYIDFEPYFGSKKGAHLTLLEGSGNEFDQCALLVALLRAAGHAPSYKYGPCSFSYSQLVSWMGLSATPYDHWTNTQFADYYGITDRSASNIAKQRQLFAVYEFLNPRGYYYFEPFTIGTTNYYSIPHVWVELDGHRLSPALKPYINTAGINLTTATGYSRSQILADAAGTTDGNGTTGTIWVSGLNYAALTSRLNTYTQNFLTYVRNNYDEYSVEKIAGSRKISTAVYASFDDVLDIFPDDFATDWLPYETWSVIPDVHMSKVRIRAGTYNYTNKTWTTTTFDQTVKMPALKGRKISLTFQGNTGRVYLDETLLGSTFTVSGAAVDLGLDATHNHYNLTRQTNGTYLTSNQGRTNQAEVKSYLKGDSNAYAVVYSFANADKLLRERQEVLDAYRRNGLTETDWRVKTEILNILGLAWFYQTHQQALIIGPQFNALEFHHHRFGRVGQEQSYYIDVGLQFGVPTSRSFNFTREDQFAYLTSFFASAMEHGVIEQQQSETNNAASTVKMIQVANQLGQRIYRAVSSNWTTVSAQLLNYPAATKTAIQTSVNTRQGKALLPRNADNAVSQWHGLGYALEEPGSILMAISGGYNGGYNGNAGTVNLTQATNNIVSDPAYSTSSSTTLRVPYSPLNTAQQASDEPIDMASGAYFLDKTEMTLGQTEPRGLTLSRHYNSNRRYDKSGGLGYGWTHNYNIYVTKRSSLKAGLGETISYQAAPFFVSLLVASDLYSNHASAKEWATAALATHWGTEQLKYNGAAVTMGNKTIEFVRMPDGTYIPPAGMNFTLSVVGGNFQLTERHGSTMAFNSAGRIATITDVYNKTQTFTHSGSQLSSVSDGYGRTLTFSWAGGRINSVSDSTGRTVGFGYTGDDLTSATDVESKTYSYVYDAEHRLTVLRDPSNRIIAENIYDSKSRVSQQKSMGEANKAWNYYYSGYATIEENPAGDRTRYYYDSRGRSLGIGNALDQFDTIEYDGQDRRIGYTTPKNESTFFYYDANNNLTLLIDPDIEGVFYTYDSSLHLQTVRDKRLKTTTYTYNTKHQVLSVSDPLTHVTTNTYDGNGNLQTVKDAANNVTTYGYDAYGQVNLITYSDTKTRSFSNNARGDALSETTPNAQTTNYTYNKRRQPLTITGPGSTPAINTYSDEGQLATAADELGNTTSYVYNAADKLVTTTYPSLPVGNNVVTNVYDNRDWLSSASNSLGENVAYIYDAGGRVTSVTAPLSRTTVNTYDANRRITEVKDPLNRIIKTSFSTRGEPLTSTDAMLKNTGYGYDANGNRTALTNRRNQSFSFVYDDANRLTSSKTPLLLTTGQTWTPHNLLETVTEPSTQTATFSYDNRTRVQSKTDPVGTVTYGYDNNGNVLTVTQGTATITRTYDSRNRVLSATDAAGNVVGYRYDNHGNLTKLIYPGNKEVNYTYTSRNNIATVTDWNNRVTTYQYDRVGRMTGMTRHNGTTATQVRDAAGRVTEMRESANGKMFWFHKFGYDTADQITSEFVSPKPHPFSPPAIAASYDIDNRLQTWSGQAVTLDNDGNMTSGPLLSSTPVSYTYNSRNQLLSSGGVTYTYDAEGVRTSRTQGGQATTFIVDSSSGPLSRVLIKNTPGAGNTFYVYGQGLLYEVSDQETTKVHHFNYTGSTIARTNDSGVVIGRVEYSPYGTITYQFGDTDTPFLFNGQFAVMTDPNGLLYMRARYYNPYMQRFLNPDPMGFSGGMNWFAFADGNPISNVDPFGLWSMANSFGVLKAIGGVAEAIAGGALATATGVTGVGAVAGGLVFLHGIDTFQSGLRQAFSGNVTDSVTSQGLQSAGLSRQSANLVDAGIGIVGSFGASAASGALRTAGGLVHLTDEAAAASIQSSQILRGASYAGPASNAAANGVGVTVRTGLAPGAYAAVPIPKVAEAAFRPVIGVGPITTWQAATGQVFTANGVLNLATGVFTRSGANVGQATFTTLDALVTGARVGGAFIK